MNVSNITIVTRRSCLVEHIGENRTIEVTREDMSLLLNSEINQSLDMVSDEGKLSPDTREKLQQLSKNTGVGPIKIVCVLGKDGHANCVEVLGFVGIYKVLLNANKSERYHGLLMLGENKIL